MPARAVAAALFKFSWLREQERIFFKVRWVDVLFSVIWRHALLLLRCLSFPGWGSRSGPSSRYDVQHARQEQVCSSPSL
jgi:hypothetical protein